VRLIARHPEGGDGFAELSVGASPSWNSTGYGGEGDLMGSVRHGVAMLRCENGTRSGYRPDSETAVEIPSLLS
jgi:hypothetical protein